MVIRISSNETRKKESSLIPTLRSKNLADVSTECLSLSQGKSDETSALYTHPLTWNLMPFTYRFM